jgi:hypothetical protein
MKNISDKFGTENQNIYFFYYAQEGFSESLLYNVKKYGRAGQTTCDNMAHEHCLPDDKDYKQIFRICNT